MHISRIVLAHDHLGQLMTLSGLQALKASLIGWAVLPSMTKDLLINASGNYLQF